MQSRWHEAHCTPVEFCAHLCGLPWPRHSAMRPSCSRGRSFARARAGSEVRNSFEIEPNVRFSQEEAGSAREGR